jgi:UDP-N-acetylmuramoyl-L-alanyl-D-glutamate--2,6-diaminopimelate ligase
MSMERPALPRGTYLVVGLGKAGSAAVQALLSCRAAERVLAWDSASTAPVRGVARRLRGRRVEVSLGGDGRSALADAGSAATIVKSPGIDFETPIIQCAEERGLCVLDELELGWRMSRGPIIAVTGTNGKSTTTRLLAAVVEASGERAELAGNTEFGPPLSAAGSAGWTVCEVSSFQLEACPSFLPDIAVFTNLTPEHLTRHLTMERYGAAKRRLFVRAGRAAPVAVINLDDPFGGRLAREVTQAGGRVLTYGFAGAADVQIERADWDMRRARLSMRTPDGRLECPTRLPGAYNASNVAAAFAMGHALGLSARRVAEALARVRAPAGRWELVSGSAPFDVLVDYAHTPDGIRQLLQSVRAAVRGRNGARVRTVFGAVGLRDSEKARESARVVSMLSDQLILTTGSAPRDPRMVRLDELRRAAASEGAVEVVLARRAAIERAIGAASPGDVVAVLGLGALGRQVLDAAGSIAPHDDREAAREILARMGKRGWS